MSYDSRVDTLLHIDRVRSNLHEVVADLQQRACDHDRSKTEQPELAVFDRVTPRLAEAQYGTDEYRDALADMGDGLEHHYRVNDHHPEHFPDGVWGMNLLQLLEMLADWRAAGQRPGGTNDLRESIDLNARRFSMSAELKAHLLMTADALGWL